MPAIHAVMKAWHPMIGGDFHVCWPPGSPSPVGPAPYFVSHMLFGTGMMSSYAKSHLSQGLSMAMQQGTDIGILIPHIGAPSVLTPLDILSSGSKSYFGSSQYMVENMPCACALISVTNYNINCGSPLPAPTGLVLALNTHLVSMSLADVLGALCELAVDYTLEIVLGKVADGVSSAVTRQIRRRFGRRVFQNAVRRYSRATGRQVDRAALNFAHMQARNFSRRVDAISGRVVGPIIGSPIGGYGNPTLSGAATSSTQELGREGGEAVGNYLDGGGEQIPEYP